MCFNLILLLPVEWRSIVQIVDGRTIDFYCGAQIEDDCRLRSSVSNPDISLKEILVDSQHTLIFNSSGKIHLSISSYTFSIVVRPHDG